MCILINVFCIYALHSAIKSEKNSNIFLKGKINVFKKKMLISAALHCDLSPYDKYFDFLSSVASFGPK